MDSGDNISRAAMEAAAWNWLQSTKAAPHNARALISAIRSLPPAPVEGEGLREALEWYGEQARLCRLIHAEGDAGRSALATDGGKRARAALSQTPGGEGG